MKTQRRPQLVWCDRDGSLRWWIARLALLFLSLGVLGRVTAGTPGGDGLRVGMFDVDATPPIGSRLAYDPVTNKWDLGLRARGVVILGAGDPIVLCAVDWIGIANEGQDVFKAALARGAGTVPERTAVHTLHQHDAPECDFSAERILRSAGVDALQYDGHFQRRVVSDLEVAVQEAVARAVPLTHVGFGEAEVREVASNRRIKGPDGKVKAVRWSAATDAAVRAEPEGLIDPRVKLVSFWNGDVPVAVLSYYATHPQSYYRTGLANPDFPGVARFMRQMDLPVALHVHFNGAGGNITAGKYNDGAPTNRVTLARKLADGMRRAWESTRKEPIAAEGVGWDREPVRLPLNAELSVEKLEAQLKGREAGFMTRNGAGRLAWVRRVAQGRSIDVTCLRLGSGRILHLPGELFVEYQLGAQGLRKDLFVAMAAYGDYAPFYIGTEVAYEEGGYETGPGASNVGPGAESVLMAAIRRLLTSTQGN